MSRKTNKVAALTGSIATGKSFVSAYFKNEFGVYIVDADKIGHSILEKPEVVEIIRQEFGKEIIHEGTVNRRMLGKIVFSDHKKLTDLNTIVHPLLIKEALATIEFLSPKVPVIFEAAILFEAGWHKYFDTVILTTCEPSIQLKRIVKRDGVSENEALARISSQMPYEDKSLLADYIVDTSQGIDAVSDILDEIAEKLLKP
ncbi:MAG TPA: dephospho-CoA kinase [bacterium]|nr:dephospho-CoA kinase [bacterium]